MIHVETHNATLLPSDIRLGEEGREGKGHLDLGQGRENIFLREYRHNINGGFFYRGWLAQQRQPSLAVKCVRIGSSFAKDLDHEFFIKNHLLMKDSSTRDNQELREHVILPDMLYTNKTQEIDKEQRYYFMTSDLANQGDLYERIQKGVEEAIYIDEFRQIVKAIKFLHDRNIYHRDLKPENIAVHEEGNKKHLYIIDFGKASVQNNISIADCCYGTVSVL